MLTCLKPASSSQPRCALPDLMNRNFTATWEQERTMGFNKDIFFFLFPFIFFWYFLSFVLFCIDTSKLSLSLKLKSTFYVFRCVCDKGRHWGQHHRGISSLQPVRNLRCMRTLGLYGTHKCTLRIHKRLLNCLFLTVAPLLGQSRKIIACN